MDKGNEASKESVMFRSDDISIPFCGRIDELSLILEAYERCKNECNVVWIHGVSGVGKSKLVQHCLKEKVNYCYGKFDLLASSKPYSIIVKVMSEIIELLLDSSPGVRVAPDQAFMLTKLVPDIRKVLNYEGIEELSFNKDFQEFRGKSGEWSFQKLKEAVKTFMKGACEQLMLLSSIPLIWFVDDFQWADLKSLEIITYLLSGELWKGFLFVGSYRDGETPEDGPFGALKKAVHQSAAKVTDILLRNLTERNVHNFLTNMTNNQLENSESLAEKIYAKTNGNPLFTTYSVQYLLEKGVLNYSIESEKWIYNEHDDFLVFFESAFDVFMFSLYCLHSETLETLKVASCIGLDVDIPLLESVLNEFDVTATPEKLKAVLREANSRHVIAIDPTEKKFTFAHDRIREAAYELASSVETHEAMHLKIGRHIIRLHGCVIEADFIDQTLFAIDQLNRGRSLIHANCVC